MNMNLSCMGGFHLFLEWVLVEGVLALMGVGSDESADPIVC